MIIARVTQDKIYRFMDENEFVEGNVYTAIIGKNGSGKSRLLNSIIQDLLSRHGYPYIFDREQTFLRDESFSGRLIFRDIPRKIIAVSTSPFDKFPLPKRNEPIGNYSYLGLRGLCSNNLGLAYMSKIINSLISTIMHNPSRAEVVGHVLNYLGYSDEVWARFELSMTISRVKAFIQSEDPVGQFARFLSSQSMRNIDRSFYFDHDGHIDINKVYETFRIFERFTEYTSKPRFDLVINMRGVNLLDILYEINGDFLFLIQSGIAKLRDVTLEKCEFNQRVTISDASSGEQSVVMAMLGIASQIEDQTLVCIDEPEVCLHPEWQERYIDLLVTAFSNYRGCQFIIATHSPQIVSNLPERNCNIMSMETGHFENSRDYQHRSADYQLAAIFKAPGHRNEYLNRIALNTFVKVGKNKIFDHKDMETLNFLNESIENIRTNDPLYDLIIALQEMFNKYGKCY